MVRWKQRPVSDRLGGSITGVVVLLRVALSRLVGAEVMGLYQLLMPVCSVLLSLTAVGLTAAMSNLSSQYLAEIN